MLHGVQTPLPPPKRGRLSGHLPWKGRKFLQLIGFLLRPEIPPPPRGSGRRPRGFMNDAESNKKARLSTGKKHRQF